MTAAAVITPTMVQTEDVPTNIIYGGTERRLKKVYLEGPKATQADWFLLSTYIGETDAANVVHCSGTTMATGDALAVDAITYDRQDFKVVMSSAGVGISFAEVLYFTE